VGKGAAPTLIVEHHIARLCPPLGQTWTHTVGNGVQRGALTLRPCSAFVLLSQLVAGYREEESDICEIRSLARRLRWVSEAMGDLCATLRRLQA
jgi:hypothetical protein